MEPQCQACQKDVGQRAMVCSFECTFCIECSQEMDHICPNCQGELKAQTSFSNDEDLL